MKNTKENNEQVDFLFALNEKFSRKYQELDNKIENVYIQFSELLDESIEEQ